MRYFAALLFSGLLLSTPNWAAAQDKEQAETPRTFEYQEGDSTYTMKQYIMVLLRRGDKALDYSALELEKLQAGHMENMNRLAEMGKLIVAGPFGDDGDLRGILIMDCATVEEAKELVATDPAVKAGRLRGEFHPWWGAVGTTLK